MAGGTARHRKVATTPDDPAAEVGTTEWNDDSDVFITHAQVDGVGIDDHHARDHALNGSAHIGLLDDTQIPAGIARDAEVTTAVANHAAAGDPHPVYLTAAEGDAAYRPIGYVPTHASTTGQTVNDHHARDHHATHEPAGADPMAVDAAAATGSLRTLGAGAAQAVSGTDARLSDSRTPLAHGASLHTDITRKLFLPAALAKLDVATAVNLGASPNLTGAVAYADAATQGAFWTFEVPDDYASGVITIQPVWSPGASDAVAHTVRWSMTCKTCAAGVVVTGAGTTVAFTGASLARVLATLVYDTATSTTLSPAAAGDLFTIELQRIGADAADTYVGVVNLLGIIVSYTANQ